MVMRVEITKKKSLAFVKKKKSSIIKMDTLCFVARGMHFGILDAVLGRPEQKKVE